MSPHIVFTDSGAGGLPYLQKTRELLPDAVFSYVADPEHFPYGQKTADTLIPILISNTRHIIDTLSPDVIVIACNTASVVGLSVLREQFNVPFVGVVPAVKPAAGISRNKRIGILATRETVDNSYTQELINTFAVDTRVFKYPGVDIVDFIENQFFGADASRVYDVLGPAADYFCTNNVDAVVLGCTHFLHIKPHLKKLLGPEISIVDSVEGVARQVAHIASGIKSLSREYSGISGMFTATESTAGEGLERFASMFGLAFMGVLP